MSRKAKHAIGEVFLITMAVNIMSELARVLLCLFWRLQMAVRRLYREDLHCDGDHLALQLLNWKRYLKQRATSTWAGGVNQQALFSYK